MRRTLVLLIATTLAAVALAGCANNAPDGGTTTTSTPPTGGTSTTTPPTGQPTQGGSLTVGTTDSITSLDPGNAYEYLSVNILQNTMGNLLVNKPHSADLVPELATGMPTVSADGLTYTFTIKAGAKYADGTAIKAEDFLWALERNSGQVAGGEGGPAFLIYDSPGVDIANSTASGSTLTIKLKQPGVFFNSLIVFPNFAPIPKAKYTTSAWVEPTGPTANLPISSGPYQISEYRQGEFIKLTKNPNYDGPRKGKLDTITIKFFSTSSSLKTAIQNGEVDMAFRGFTPDEWKDLVQRGGQIQTKEEPGPSPMRYLTFNVNKTGSGMEKREVRQAIAYIVDRDQINEVVFDGTVDPAYSVVAAGLPGAKETYKSRYGTDPDAAKAAALMQTAGYSTTNKLQVELWYNSDGHYGDTEDELAILLKDQLDRSGYFAVTLQSKPWAEYKVDFRAGNYAMFLLGWYPDYLDTDDYISPFFTPGGGRSFGTFYNNADLQPKIKAEQAEDDVTERIKILGEIQDIVTEDNPMLPLFSGKQQVAWRSGVSGVTLSPTSVFPYYTLSKS